VVYIYLMVVHDPLDFNFLLEEDYVYAMQDFVSTLFRVMCFPHNGSIMSIDQLSFIVPHMISNHMTSLNGPYMPASSTPSQVNYVANYPMHSTSNEKEYLPSSELDPIVDMVISSIGILEPDLPTPIAPLDMYSFQSVFLLSSEDLLEAMIDFCPLTCIPS
jgi:hypothetical protein